MAARSIGSGTISFGMVLIPFKIYTAVSPKSVSFNMLHKKCGSRLKQQLVCPVDNVVIDRADTVRGFEYATDQYVKFSDEEFKALETARTNALVLEEFVPASSVDFLYIEKTYFIGPDKGPAAARAYAMLAQALERSAHFAVGRFAQRGKDNLTLVRPYRGGLVIHQCYYANEVNSFDSVEIGPGFTFKPQEHELADTLIKQLAKPAFEPKNFRDEWAETVLKAVQQKVAGEEIAPVPEQTRPVMVDLLEALRRSVAANDEKLDATRAEVARLEQESPPPETVAQASTVLSKGPRKAAPRSAKPAPKKRQRGGG